MTDYLTLAEVVAMHADQIERYGGSPGLRDPGLLESALYRPQTGDYADLVEEAAALWESLAPDHPFRRQQADRFRCDVHVSGHQRRAVDGDSGRRLCVGLGRFGRIGTRLRFNGMRRSVLVLLPSAPK